MSAINTCLIDSVDVTLYRESKERLVLTLDATLVTGTLVTGTLVIGTLVTGTLVIGTLVTGTLVTVCVAINS